LHVAQCPPQVLAYGVLADSKHVRDFADGKSLNLLQEVHIPARRRKQQGPEHDQLECSAGILAWYDGGSPVGIPLLDGLNIEVHPLYPGPIPIVFSRREAFREQIKKIEHEVFDQSSLPAKI
jgi:hypothetical protein